MAVVTGTAVFAVPAALTWDVGRDALPYVLASAGLELAYFGLLAAAYAAADYAFAYPVARGTAPVLVLVVSVTALGAAISGWAAAGIVAVAVGVVLVRGVGAGAPGAGALALALGTGACIAAYTLVDKHGVAHAAPLPYFEAVLAIVCLPYLAGVGRARGWDALRRAARPPALLAGVGMAGAFVLVLTALAHAEAAAVSALRETSVVIGAAGAAIAGRDRVPARRVAGAGLVVAGVLAVALG